MHARNLSLALGLTLGGLAGCGDDSSTNPDGRPADAAPDAGSIFKGYDADEGGEIRIEYVRFGGGNAGLRIDHFLLSPSLKKRLRAAEVDREARSWEKTSDHAPVWIELAD